MPELTNDDAASGFNGLTVVVAFLKDATPATQKKLPNTTISRDKGNRSAKLNVRFGVINDIPHISTANNKVITGGGILFSSIDIVSLQTT
ncbi:Sulfite reductase [NADPH] hemoprotein beta-component [Moritella viscosa]|nr:Sulfite reductase [NADPH] hemoprotein beta-component [Moritella viscosa]SHO02635.1 Sulfite reductase [NADPH] hemoprotein beta-component [Moritella viscosa]SHO20787.1 Sulfite reductase [NADPH] hemoprotein beta-component [Moritella viscosa]